MIKIRVKLDMNQMWQLPIKGSPGMYKLVGGVAEDYTPKDLEPEKKGFKYYWNKVCNK